jgi:hypothetical protein
MAMGRCRSFVLTCVLIAATTSAGISANTWAAVFHTRERVRLGSMTKRYTRAPLRSVSLGDLAVPITRSVLVKIASHPPSPPIRRDEALQLVFDRIFHLSEAELDARGVQRIVELCDDVGRSDVDARHGFGRNDAPIHRRGRGGDRIWRGLLRKRRPAVLYDGRWLLR